MLVDMAQREYINNINLQTNAPQITVNATSASSQPIDGESPSKQDQGHFAAGILCQHRQDLFLCILRGCAHADEIRIVHCQGHAGSAHSR